MLLTIAFYNDIISTTIGYASNILLIFLIRTSTTKDFKAYSQILLQQSIVDLIFNTVNVLTMEQLEVYEGMLFLTSGSVARNTVNTLNFFLHMCFIFATFFAIITTTIPFIYRYFLLCRETKLSTNHIVLLFVISALLALGFVLFCGLSFRSQQESHTRYSALLDKGVWGEKYGYLPSFIAVEINNPTFSFGIIYLIILLCLIYSANVWCAQKVWHKISKTKNSMRRKTLKLQKQLSIALVIQASCPLFVTFLPLCYVFILFIFNIRKPGIALPVLMSVPWISALSPLSSILLVGPYRVALTKFVKRKPIQKSQEILLESAFSGVSMTC